MNFYSLLLTRRFSKGAKVQSIQERRNSVEKLLDFEIAAFSRHLHREGKKVAILNLRSFSTEWHCSYIDCALGEGRKGVGRL